LDGEIDLSDAWMEGLWQGLAGRLGAGAGATKAAAWAAGVSRVAVRM